MTMTIPGEQQLVFDAADATEFRALLGRILDTSPLSCGQIAIKTGMPRSTAYSLPDTKRPGLPSNPKQVTAFVKACGLTPTQVDLVMDLWTQLHRETENVRNSGNDDNKGKDATVSGRPASWATAPEALRRFEYKTIDYKDLLACAACHDDAEISSEIPLLVTLGQYNWEANWRSLLRRNTSWTELLHYILGDERRTRHAVMLLIPITLLLLGIVCALVFLAIQTPTITPLVVAGLLAPFLITLRKASRNPKKKVND